MFIFYNGEILTNVSLLRNSENSALCLDYYGWRYYKSFSENVTKQKSYPCVILPDFTKDDTWEKCTIGYMNFDSMDFTSSEILQDHFIIKQIEVCRKSGVGNLKIRGGYCPDLKYSEFYYKIEICFFENDTNSKLTTFNSSYVFQSYDIIWNDFDGFPRKKYSKTIQYLFVDFPEKIKNYLESNEQEHYFYKRPLRLLNFDLLQKEWPNKEMYNYPVYSSVTASHEYLFDRNDKLNLPYSLREAIKTLHTIEIEKKDDIIVKFGNGELIYLNIYFERIFEFAFNHKLLYDKESRIAYCHLKNDISFNLSSNDDIAAYIACVMHLYLYRYFDLEASRELYLVSIPQSTNEYSEIYTSLPNMKKIDIEEYFYDIYRFIFCCKIEHKQEGFHRVGRDDKESSYKSYEFRPRKGYKAPTALIKKIDSLLQTKLEYEKETTGWNSHSERYYYCNVYWDGATAGLAKNKDLGSVELKNSSFYFISNYFIMEYLVDREDFKRFTK